MRTFEEAYPFLPAGIQDLACSAAGLRITLRRYRNGYAAIQNRALITERLPPEELRSLQCSRLQHAVVAAAATPYYRRLFQRLRLDDPRDIRTPEDLGLLPIINKRIVQEARTVFYHPAWKKMRSSIVHTSGTTGSGLVFPMTLKAEQEQWAVWWRYRARFGIDRKTWYAHFYGRSIVPFECEEPPFWRINYIGRQILFSGYHMSDRYLPHYVAELNRRKPPWIQGYPSLLAVLAGYMLSSGRGLEYLPKVVTVGAESLLPHQKKLIEKAFGTACRQHYGMTEAVANISECREGRLHVDEDFGLVEFVPDGARGGFRLVATGFVNDAFPLLRYDTGDDVALGDRDVRCPCGNAGRIVESIDGRIEDYVVTPDGRRIGRLDHIVKDMVNIRECQFVQARLDRLELRVVRGPHYGEDDERILLKEARQRLGGAIDIQPVYVDQLERSRTGKLRFVISHLADGRIEQQEDALGAPG